MLKSYASGRCSVVGVADWTLTPRTYVRSKPGEHLSDIMP